MRLFEFENYQTIPLKKLRKDCKIINEHCGFTVNRQISLQILRGNNLSMIEVKIRINVVMFYYF